MAGYTFSGDSDVVGYHGLGDCWIIKFDAANNVQWKKTYGGTYNEDATSIVATQDGGYVVAGYTNSSDGDIVGTGYHPSGTTSATVDYFVFKIDSVGNIVWKKCFGGTDDELASSIIQTKDKGFLIAGFSLSMDGDVTDHRFMFPYLEADYWVVKLDSLGNKMWAKSYGGYAADAAKALAETANGDIYIAGTSNSASVDVTNNNGKGDYWLVKINASGNIIWQKNFGGTNSDDLTCVLATTDGGCVVSGTTWSTNGDVTGNHGSTDIWVLKLDSSGNVIWKKCYGGSGGEEGMSIQYNFNKSGYIIIGSTTSSDGDVNGLNGLADVWIVSFDTVGNILWKNCYGGSSFDNGTAITTTNDDGYCFIGKSLSSDIDLTANYGDTDWWVVKLAPDPLPLKFTSYSVISRNDKSVENSWTTTNEINVSHYNVERSTNAKDFVFIGKVKAKNKSSNQYSFTDPLATSHLPLTLYYRIVAIDNDGKKTYSEVRVVISNHQSTINAISVYPNPATSYIKVTCNNVDAIEIVNNSGILLTRLKPQNQFTIINVANYPKGTYYVVIHSKGSITTKKIIIN